MEICRNPTLIQRCDERKTMYRPGGYSMLFCLRDKCKHEENLNKGVIFGDFTKTEEFQEYQLKIKKAVLSGKEKDKEDAGKYLLDKISEFVGKIKRRKNRMEMKP